MTKTKRTTKFHKYFQHPAKPRFCIKQKEEAAKTRRHGEEQVRNEEPFTTLQKVDREVSVGSLPCRLYG